MLRNSQVSAAACRYMDDVSRRSTRQENHLRSERHLVCVICLSQQAKLRVPHASVRVREIMP